MGAYQSLTLSCELVASFLAGRPTLRGDSNKGACMAAAGGRWPHQQVGELALLLTHRVTSARPFLFEGVVSHLYNKDTELETPRSLPD